MPVTPTEAYDDLRLVQKQVHTLQQLKLSPEIGEAISVTCRCVDEFSEVLSEEKTDTNTSGKSADFKALAMQARSIFAPPPGEQSSLSRELERSSAIKNGL